MCLSLISILMRLIRAEISPSKIDGIERIKEEEEEDNLE